MSNTTQANYGFPHSFSAYPPYNPVFHPVICIVGEISLFIYAAGFTSARSIQRLLIFFLISIWSTISISWSRVYVDSTGFMARVPGGMMFAICLSFLGRLLILQRSFEDQQKETQQEKSARQIKKRPSTATKPARTPSNFSKRLAFAQEVAGDTRGLDLNKHVPPFSRSNPNYIPTYSTLLLTTSTSLLFCLLAHDVGVDILLLLTNNPISISRLQPILPWLTTLHSPILIAIRSTLSYWLVQYSMLEAQHSLGTLLSLITTSPSPAEIKTSYRPQFGSPTQAYTVRRFWGSFWHQQLRDFISVPSRSIVYDDILRMRKGGVVGRYTFVFFCFFFSGALHVSADVAGPLPRLGDAMGAMWFFTSQTVAFMVEDGVQEVYGRWRKRQGGRKVGKLEGIAIRLVGYVWVVAWLSLTTPIWVHPPTRLMRREDAVLQKSAFMPVVAWFFRR